MLEDIGEWLVRREWVRQLVAGEGVHCGWEREVEEGDFNTEGVLGFDQWDRVEDNNVIGIGFYQINMYSKCYRFEFI